MELSRSTTLRATVCQICDRSLLVCDHCTGQRVLIHTDDACCYRVGERLCIHFNGAMTNSLPPQITATCIEPLRC